MKRALYIVFGLLAVGLGTLGVLVVAFAVPTPKPTTTSLDAAPPPLHAIATASRGED